MKSLFEEKEAVAGAAPIGGSTGAGSPQGAKSPHSQAHSEGCDSGKGVARGAHDGTVCAGGLPDAEAAAARLNPLGGLRETGGLPFFLPEGRTYSPPRRGGSTCRWQAVRSPRGIAAVATASRQCHITCGGAAVIVCAIGQIPSFQPTLFLQPPAQTCHRQLCRRDGRASCPSIFSFAKEKQKKGIEVNEIWQFIIWKRR